MDRLWAPWRKAYIRPKRRKKPGCVFCQLLSEKKDARNYILKRSAFSFAVLNLYPYNNGHVLILPNRHTASLAGLTSAARLDWLALSDEVMGCIERKIKPHGFNVGINLGKAAGAGIPSHLHLHIVPRWPGDMNFMPVVAGPKVISESLDSIYQFLAGALTSKKKKSKGARNRN